MRRLNSAMATPGPKPISRTRSVDCTLICETTHTLRWRLEARCAITQPTMLPAAPRGCPNCRTIALLRACFHAMEAVDNFKYA